MRLWAAVVLGVFSFPVFGQVQVGALDPRHYARGQGGGRLHDHPQQVRAARAPRGRFFAGRGKVETHIHIKDGDVVRMREVKGYDIPANGVFELKPGGAHLMLVDLKRPLKEGEKVSLVLKFEKSGEVKVDFEVRPLVSTHKEHSH